jgi:predicted phosphoribosyltransferase
MNNIFKDRHDAAMQLAGRLEKFRGKNGIVLAVPRGGVPIGFVIAKELGLPLEIILSKKIGHPKNPEFAIGAVTLQGAVVNDNVMDVDMDYIHRTADKILDDLKKKFKLYMGDHKPADLKNKTVIIVDDGVATGSTIKATIHAIRKNNPKEIIVAIPVSPPETARELSEIADEFICLHTPHDFYGVGQFYDDFAQVSDEEVIQHLKEIHSNSKAA